MRTIQDIVRFLEEFAPRGLAEDWDNVGLLLGDRRGTVSSIMTCLTLTPDVAAEAIESKCQLVITHHPVLFRAVKRITADTPEGAMLLDLIRAGVAVYSPHTGYDSAAGGINAQLAALLELRDVQPLRPAAAEIEAVDPEGDAVGGGRWGTLPAPTTLAALLGRVKQTLNVSRLQYVGAPNAPVARVAIACGSAAEFLSDAIRCRCDAFLLGEARFHSCLEARQAGIALVLPGHYATEQFAMERLAGIIQSTFPEVAALASRRERDPLAWD